MQLTTLIRYTNKNVNKIDLYHSTNPTNYTFGMNRTVLTVHDLIAAGPGLGDSGSKALP